MSIRRKISPDFHLDSNRINGSGRLKYVNIMETLGASGVINLKHCETVDKEIAREGASKRVAKTFNRMIPHPLISTDEEHSKLRSIEAVLFPNWASTNNEKNDVLICFTAMKYSAVLVTNDGASKSQPRGILGCKDELARIGVSVMRDHEAVSLIKRKIKERDTMARETCQINRLPLPDWIGRDLVLVEELEAGSSARCATISDSRKDSHA
jgi:hypothetical protein